MKTLIISFIIFGLLGIGNYIWTILAMINTVEDAQSQSGARVIEASGRMYSLLGLLFSTLSMLTASIIIMIKLNRFLAFLLTGINLAAGIMLIVYFIRKQKEILKILQQNLMERGQKHL